LEEHEEAGEILFIGMIILGLAGGAAFWVTMKKENYSIGIPLAVLIAGLILVTMAVRTGYLGGKIRHSEVYQGQAGGGGGGEKNGDDD
jgi:uncharacterized membrane protein